MYKQHFGDAGENFSEACRQVVATDAGLRMGTLILGLFADSKVPNALNQRKVLR